MYDTGYRNRREGTTSATKQIVHKGVIELSFDRPRLIAKRDEWPLVITKDDQMTQLGPRETVLQVTDLSVTYQKGVVALRPTSIDFRRGEFTVLLGRSGAGKSTLLRALNHLVAPTTGAVTSKQHGRLDSVKALRAHRRQTAMVFQQHHLIERHSALANVLTGRLAHHSGWRTLFPLPRHDVEFALHCLERVGLADKALSRADQLSGGQQQRVGIARALAQKPCILLADEPVASLDPATSETVLDLLRTICREDGITAIISLHQIDYAQRYSDRIVGLADANIVFDGPPNSLSDSDYSRIYHAQLGAHQRAVSTPHAITCCVANLELTQ